jgi:hypothetical protein
MSETGPAGRSERELVGEPIQVGAYTLRPVAHLDSRFGAPKRDTFALVWGYSRLDPVAVIVDGPGGSERRIAIAGPDNRAAQRLLLAGMLVAAVSAAAIVLSRPGR